MTQIAATEEDRKALAEAAQNGELSAKMLEERLAAQRSSFEVSLAGVSDEVENLKMEIEKLKTDHESALNQHHVSI